MQHIQPQLNSSNTYEPDTILHTEADLCYFTGLFIPPINLANSKPKLSFLVTQREQLFLKSTGYMHSKRVLSTQNVFINAKGIVKLPLYTRVVSLTPWSLSARKNI